MFRRFSTGVVSLALFCLLLSACAAQPADLSNRSSPPAPDLATAAPVLTPHDTPTTPYTGIPSPTAAAAGSLPDATPLTTVKATATIVAVAQTALNLRAGPGTDYPIVGGVAGGDRLLPVGQARACAWVRVRVPGRTDTVWVSGSYLELSAPCADIGVPENVPAATLAPATAVAMATRAPITAVAATGAAVSTPVGVATIRPQSYLVGRYTDVGGRGELTIKNGTDSDGVCILVIGSPTNPIQAAYIRQGDSYTMTNIPDGNYQLYFEKGVDWDAEKKTFGRSLILARFADSLLFKTTWSASRVEWSTYTVTLYGVVDGNARTELVPKDQFPTLP